MTTIYVTITDHAARELAYRCDVVRDDHGEPGYPPCAECDELDENGDCEQRRHAAAVGRQVRNLSERFAGRVPLAMTHDEGAFAATELARAAEWCHHAAATEHSMDDTAGRMKALADKGSCLAAARRIWRELDATEREQVTP